MTYYDHHHIHSGILLLLDSHQWNGLHIIFEYIGVEGVWEAAQSGGDVYSREPTHTCHRQWGSRWNSRLDKSTRQIRHHLISLRLPNYSKFHHQLTCWWTLLTALVLPRSELLPILQLRRSSTIWNCTNSWSLMICTYTHPSSLLNCIVFVCYCAVWEPLLATMLPVDYLNLNYILYYQ